MKKRGFLLFILLAALALPLGIQAEESTVPEGRPLTQTDALETQRMVDEALQAEKEAGYDFSDPLVIVDPYQASPLSAVVLFHTDEALGGTVTVRGKAECDNVYGTFAPETDHLVPVYGLYNGETTEVLLTLEDGRETTVEITTEKQNLSFGELEARMLKEDAYDYGCLTFIYPFGNTIYAVDSAGDIRWCYSGGGTMGVHPLKNGHLLLPMPFTLKTTYYKEGLQEIDLSGRIYAQYLIPGGQHHDFQELPNGNLLAASDAPDLSTIEDWVVEIDRETGEVVWSVDLKDLLPVGDGQSASMDTDGSEESDWCHNNAVWYDAENDLVLLSCRHLDAIVAIDKAEKTLAWILGDPAGWEEAEESLFFTPAGEDFSWFYAQHQVTQLENGDILLFDNGTAKVKRADAENRVSGADVYSRAVAYRLDTEAMTAEQVFEYGRERGAEWYSDWVSGAETLDGTADSLWITAGSHLYSPEEDRHDFYPSDMMKPGLIKSAHFDQVTGGELVYELTVSGETYLSLAYRSSRMPLYAPGRGLDPSVPAVVLGSLGETPWEEASVSLEDLPALSSSAWQVALDERKLSVQGLYESEKAAEELGSFALILSSPEGARSYALSALPAPVGGVTVSGWVSRVLPEGRYQVLLLLDDEVYDTGLWWEESAENEVTS